MAKNTKKTAKSQSSKKDSAKRGTKPQLQFRPEPQVDAALRACIKAHKDVPISQLVNMLVAHGLESIGLSPWELPAPNTLGWRDWSLSVAAGRCLPVSKTSPSAITVGYKLPGAEKAVA